MMFLKCLFSVIFAVLVGAVPLRAAPVVKIELPVDSVFVNDSFSLTVRATGPIETFQFLLDFPASLVTPPREMSLSAYRTAGDRPSESETLAVGGVVDFGFHLDAVPEDYPMYLPSTPVGTGRVLGIVPQPPLVNSESEVTFTGTFSASATPGIASFLLGYFGTLSSGEDTAFSGTLDATLVISQRQPPGGGPGDGPGGGPGDAGGGPGDGPGDGPGGGPGDGAGGGSGSGPVPVSAPPALALFLVGLLGLGLSRWRVA